MLVGESGIGRLIPADCCTDNPVCTVLTSVRRLESLDLKLKFVRDTKPILHKIAKIVITTMSSVSVKALFFEKYWNIRVYIKKLFN